MDWKPNKWIAGVLGFFIQPLGMLYVNKLSWAFIYFGISIVLALFEYIALYKLHLLWLENFSFNIILMVICALHAYRISSHWEPVEVKPWYSHWYGLVSIPIVMFVAIFSFRSFMFEPFRTPSASMLPTLKVGSILITKKFGYGNYGTFGILIFKTEVSSSLNRGDVAVFQYPEKPSINYVKRIVGLPGDIIEYKNKLLTVNGELVTTKKLAENKSKVIWQEKFDSKVFSITNITTRPSYDFIVTIPKNNYFVLGDNRDNSRDSRHWGFLPKENFVGKVIYVMQ